MERKEHRLKKQLEIKGTAQRGRKESEERRREAQVNSAREKRGLSGYMK